MPEKTEDKEGLTGLMTRRPVAANLLMVFLLVGGLIMSFRIKQEVFPEFQLDLVTVTVPYPGAGPEEVEKGIVEAVEEEVRGLDGVKKVSSTAAEGVGTVVVELMEGTDANKALQDVKNAVDSITTFPEDAERPLIRLATTRHQVISLVLFGDVPRHAMRDLAERVRDELLAKKNITLVDLSGVRPMEIGVEVPRDTLRRYGLTLEQVARTIRASALELPGGGVRTRSGEILLRVYERRDWGSQFRNIPVISRPDGSRVLLGDIATIKDGFAETDDSAWFDGKPAVMLNVYRIGKQTPIDVARTVKEYAADLEKRLPPGVRVAPWDDASEIYADRMRLLLKNGTMGLVLVLLLLGAFLETKLAFWVAMGIPTSVIGSLLFLPIMGVSINMISLFAFIITLGIVVDDAIIVGENVYRLRQEGRPFLEAAIEGTRQIAMPVVFSVLTNIVAFLPMFYVPGVMGKIFKVIPAVVIIVFSISLVEALLILPAHLGHSRRSESRGVFGLLQRLQGWTNRGLGWVIERLYRPAAEQTLAHRYIAFCAGIALLLLTVGYVKSGRISLIAIPRVESDMAAVNLVLPFGSPASRTRAILARLEAAANRLMEEYGGRAKICRGVFAHVGGLASGRGPMARGGGAGVGHLGTVLVLFVGADRRPFSTQEFVARWRKMTGPVAGVESLVFKSDIGGPSAGDAVNIQLAHWNIDTLEAAAADLAGRIRRIGAVRDVDDGFSPGKIQWNFRVLPEGRSLGLTALEIGRQVRNAYYGAEALRQQRGRNEVKVMVRFPKADRDRLHSVENFILRSPLGGEIPLREAATVRPGRAYTVINRVDGRRTVNVTADVFPRSMTSPVLSSLLDGPLPEVLQRYPGLTYSLEGERRELRDSMQSLVQGFCLAMIAIFAMLAIPFDSYSQPLIVMTSIPFGIVGAVLGHVMMGYNISIISMMGIVALSGVVVNDSLVLIDYTNQCRRQGLAAKEALMAAGIRRFRPILLTSVTTFFGLMPMIFETSVQARFLVPMAISLGYGILFATGITLLLVPALYLILEDLHRAHDWLRGRPRSAPGTGPEIAADRRI
ncbi:MAG: efflux RND transporter permease subunit [Kiritimatiellaeota bacterium]|nr:efflux RND transporter permease subunit [Kiritimatiellota bacterium]